jgi:hypothetical protein
VRGADNEHGEMSHCLFIIGERERVIVSLLLLLLSVLCAMYISCLFVMLAVAL